MARLLYQWISTNKHVVSGLKSACVGPKRLRAPLAKEMLNHFAKIKAMNLYMILFFVDAASHLTRGNRWESIRRLGNPATHRRQYDFERFVLERIVEYRIYDFLND